MKITTKGRYGLRALIDLATTTNNGPVTLASIAERQGISLNYLEHVFAILKREKLVKSVKGAQGGYCLNCDAKSITVEEIVVLLEGELSIVSYTHPDRETSLERCLREALWEIIDKKIQGVLHTLTLQDMVEAYKELTLKEAF